MPSLSSFWAQEKPLEALLDEEGGHAAGARRRIGLGIDDEHVGIGTIGDPHLRAVEHVAVTLLLRPQLHRHDVRAGAGLGHGERADMLAADQLRQVAPLLGLRAVLADLVDAEIGMGAVGQADRGRGARDFLHRDAVLEIAEARPAIVLLHRDAEQAEPAHLLPEVHRELVGAVDLRGAGAISSCEKAKTVSRSMSAVSPRSKSKGRGAFLSMGASFRCGPSSGAGPWL